MQQIFTGVISFVVIAASTARVTLFQRVPAVGYREVITA
jgi:hypothetical protein